MVGIGIQDKKSNIVDYVKEKGLKWPIAFDEGDLVARIYGITFGAGVVFIDAGGVVRGRFLGGFGAEELEAEIDKIMIRD